jgi:methionyl-tRNA formyltransferase
VRVVFFGTPEPAAVALGTLLASDLEVAAVVTQPDRRRGRSGRAVPSPVKERALAGGLPVLQPESPQDPGFVGTLEGFAPDVGAVVAYGHLLPRETLVVPPRGFVNVHFSLLPRYRGAAPVQRAVMAGETVTGVSTFLLEPTFDSGPILMVQREPIAEEDTAGTLMERLTPVGADLLVRTLEGLVAGTLEPRPQDDALATPAPKIRREEAEIDWTRPASDLNNLVRGLNPAPGAFTIFRGKRLKIWRASAAPGAAMPGNIVDIGDGRLGVGTSDGVLELHDVQLEGSKRLKTDAFLRGHRPETGETLG